MKKLTFLLSALFIALTSVFAEAKLAVSPDTKAFDEVSYVKGAASVELKDTFNFTLDTAELAAPLQLSVKGGLDGVTFKAEEVAGADPAVLRVSYIATKAGEFKDSIFISSGELKDTIEVTLTVIEKVPVISVQADALAFGNIAFEEAPAGKELALTASVTEGVALAVEVSGAQKDNFIAKIEDGKLKVTFKADPAVAGNYAATATLSAQGAESKDVALTATVNDALVPAIVLGENAVAFEAKSFVKGQANVNLRDTAYVEYTTENVSDTTITLKGGVSSVFKAELVKVATEDKIRVSYNVTVAKDSLYKDTVFVNASGAKDTIALSVKINELVPSITVTPTAWKPAAVQLESGLAIAVSDAFTIDSENLFEAISITIQGGNTSNFAWNATDKTVEFMADAADTYKDTLLVVSSGVTVKVPLEITVNPAVPVITVSADALAWGEVELAAATAGIKKDNITVSVTENAALNVAVTGTNASNFVAEIKGGKLEVTFTADAAGTYAATATISATGAESKTVALSATVKPAAAEEKNFVKVTAEQTDWSGEYLLVYEKSATQAYVYKGEDATNNYVTATIEDGRIISKDLDNYIITIAKMTNGYSLQSKADGDKYMTTKSGANGISYSDDPVLNTVEYENGKLYIESGGRTIYFNTNSDQNRFRYFLNAQSGLAQLYKVSAPVVPVAATGVTLDKETASIVVGKTVTLTATVAPAEATNKKVSWSSSDESKATVADGVVTGVAEGTAVITVKTVDGEFTASCTVTVTAPVIPTGAFVLVKNAANLKAGDEIIIVESYYEVAAGAVSSGYFAKEDVEINDETITLADNSKVNVLTLGGTAGAWTFTTADDKLIGAASSNIKLGEGSTTWTISIDADADATITNTTTSNGTIRYNASSPRFKTYTSTTMALPQIYSRAGVPAVPVDVTGVTLDKETAEVEVGKTVTLNATVAPDNATNKKVTWSTSDAAIATVANGVVTGVAVGTATITVKTDDGDFTKTCVVTVKEATTPPTPTTPTTFVKVTEETNDWSGQYLIVYEAEDGAGLIFNGKDEINGYVEGEIDEDKIDVSAIDNFEDFVVTIEPMTGGWSLKVGDKYIGGKSGANALVFNAEAILNTIELDETGDANIVSNSCILSFNATSGQNRFRYYKAANQQPVALYKAEEAKATTTLSVQKTAEVAVGKTVKLTVTRDGNDKLTWGTMDATIATVDNGVVKGVKEGEVKIFVKVGNLSDTCLVTVVEGQAGADEFDVAQAMYFTDEGDAYWQIEAWKDAENEEDAYPDVYFIIDANDKTHLAGTYEIYEGGYWSSANDSIEFVGGTVTITCVEAETEDAYGVYSVEVTMYDEDGETYTYSFEVEVSAVDYDAYAAGETDYYITLLDQAGSQAIDNTSMDNKAIKQIVNGKLLIIRGENVYTPQGQLVK